MKYNLLLLCSFVTSLQSLQDFKDLLTPDQFATRRIKPYMPVQVFDEEIKSLEIHYENTNVAAIISEASHAEYSGIMALVCEEPINYREITMYDNHYQTRIAIDRNPTLLRIYTAGRVLNSIKITSEVGTPTIKIEGKPAEEIVATHVLK